MAIDGLKIIDSDSAHDIYIAITEDWKDGKPAKEIQYKILSWYQSFCFNTLETEIYWTAFAYGMWKIGHLDDYIKQQALRVIEKGADEFWQEVEDNGKKKRQKILDKLAEKIKEPNPRPLKQPKLAKPKTPYFKEGDVVAVKFDDGYGAFLVIIIDQQPRKLEYHFAMTNLFQSNLPTLKDVLDSDIFFRKTIGFDSSCWVNHKNLTKMLPHFQKIGQVRLKIHKMGTLAPKSELSEFRNKLNDYMDKNSLYYKRHTLVKTKDTVKKIIVEKI